MKKWLLVLGMITCMAGLTACGQQNKEVEDLMTTEDAQTLAVSIVDTLNQVVAQESEEDYIALMDQNGLDGTVFEKAFESWKTASEDMGSYVEMTEVVDNSMIAKEYDGVAYAEEGVLTVQIKGEQRDANVEIIYEDGLPTGVTTNVIYSFGESMEKAALNTLLGMGTVFVVLILISAIISCFNFIPKIQGMFAKKATKEEIKAEAVDNTIAQIVEKEELSDDLELVAVIAAAIAASEGAASTDGFVVRSIKRRRAHA